MAPTINSVILLTAFHLNKIITQEVEDPADKYIIDKKSEKVVDRVTISKRAISEDTQKARDFLRTISNKNLINKENEVQKNEPKSFVKKILEERNFNKNKNPNEKGK